MALYIMKSTSDSLDIIFKIALVYTAPPHTHPLIVLVHMY